MRVPDQPYNYPQHLRQQVLASPKAPGVYFFYGNNDLPLYIGKSVDIRSRLLAHLRNPDEARLLHRTQRIEYRRTAGEIAALLLESRLIKELQPLTNQRLRRKRRLCSFRLRDGAVELLDTTTLSSDVQLYGLFKNRKAATAALLKLADEYRLCHSLLGIERANGRPCFRTQIGKCAGACHAALSLSEHTQRLESALKQWAVHHWPYAGPIALYEEFAHMQEFHVINQWHYLGSYPDEEQARVASTQPVHAFDADSYKILLRPVLSGDSRLIEFT